MAGTRITVDEAQVLAIASQLEKDNLALKDLIGRSEAQINSLGNSWTGQAAEETRRAYKEFSDKFKQMYYDVIDQYAKFLRSNVAESYSAHEQANVRLADAFK